MNLFDYSGQKSNLMADYARQNAAQEFGRMMGQQRFKRQREDMTRSFQQQFPRFTGQWANRLGSGVKSGVFGQKLGEQASDFSRRMQDIDVESAQSQAQYEFEQAGRRQALERALLALKQQALAAGIKI